MEWFNEEIQKLLIAAALGAVIGMEREWRGKKAGFRTLMLVSLGSCLFTILSGRMGSASETDRIASNIVTGISFLGAGLIFKEDQVIQGLTTAATVWAAAAIGMAVGEGSYWLAFVAMCLVWLILVVFFRIQLALDGLHRTKAYRIRYRYSADQQQEIEGFFRQKGCKVLDTKLMKDNKTAIGLWTIRARDSVHAQLVTYLMEDPEVESFEY